MTTQPDRPLGQPGPAEQPGSTGQPGQPEADRPAEEPEQYEGMKLSGDEARLVKFILIVVAATLLFSAAAFFVILS